MFCIVMIEAGLMDVVKSFNTFNLEVLEVHQRLGIELSCWNTLSGVP